MKNAVVILLILFNFALGIYAGIFMKDFYSSEFTIKTELPLENQETNVQLSAPHDWISEKSIEVYNDRIIINLADLGGRKTSWSTYADSGSMLPTFGQGCNGLEFVPESPADIHIGDLIAFLRGDDLIIHRVVKTGIDAQGWFAHTQGDNNKFIDERISLEDIKYVTYGVVC